MDADRAVFALALVFLAWWVVGLQLNRRRGNTVARLIGRAATRLGRGVTIRPLGGSAFRIDLEKPEGNLSALTVVCLLEPRDFPLAWAWMRLRGHRDRIVLKAAFRRPPGQALNLIGEEAARHFDLPGLTALTLQDAEPHLHLALNLGRGPEGEENTRVERAFVLVQRLAAQAGSPRP